MDHGNTFSPSLRRLLINSGLLEAHPIGEAPGARTPSDGPLGLGWSDHFSSNHFSLDMLLRLGALEPLLP